MKKPIVFVWDKSPPKNYGPHKRAPPNEHDCSGCHVLQPRDTASISREGPAYNCISLAKIPIDQPVFYIEKWLTKVKNKQILNIKTMKVKRILGILSLAVLLIAGATACSSDDDNGTVFSDPTIKNIEVGHDNNGVGNAGSDLHLEADIEAEGLIANIQVTIHPADHDGEGWEFTQTWTEGYQNSKNAVFHEHIDIPEDAAPGEYHVHFYVIDQEGNTAKEEAHLEIHSDPNAPSWEKVEVGYEGEGVLHVEGFLSVPEHLDRITIEVHGNDGTYQKEFDFDPHDFNHEHLADGGVKYEVKTHVHIDDAPVGDYHIHIEFEGEDVLEGEVSGGTFTID